MPALLRVRLGIDEVVTTLLLNPVALLVVEALLHGPWTDPETGFPESPRIAEAAEFPKLAAFLPFLGKSRLHLGFILAIVIIVAAWWVLSRTSTGLRVRAVGLSPHGARFAGIKVERTLLRVALVSGAVAGIAGVSEVAGIQFRLTAGISPGFGYTGIVVAMLGGLTMPGVLLAGLLLGDLAVGASSAVRSLQIPRSWGPWWRAPCCWPSSGPWRCAGPGHARRMSARPTRASRRRPSPSRWRPPRDRRHDLPG